MAISSSSSEKAFIVFDSYYAEESLQYLIFVVDLNLGENCDEIDNFTDIKPNLRFDCFSFYAAAFCMSGSELFVFPGYNGCYNPDGGKSMFSYHLSDGICNRKLEKDMLVEGPSLNGIKIWPIATFTPHGKILVFSSVINVRWPDKYCDFELYDPKEMRWHKLPNMCPSSLWPKKECFRITSFTFMSEDELFLVTDEQGYFTLDIEREIWNIPAECINIPPHRGYTFVMIEKEICMVPSYAFDMVERVDFTFPQLSSPLYVDQGFSIILLDDIRKMNFDVCLIHSGINKETQDNEFILQVYGCNSKECIEKISEERQKAFEETKVLPGVTKIRSLKFVLKDKSFSRFSLCSFSYVPPKFTTLRRSPRNI